MDDQIFRVFRLLSVINAKIDKLERMLFPPSQKVETGINKMMSELHDAEKEEDAREKHNENLINGYKRSLERRGEGEE
jgi:hypothetical protein